MANATNTTTTTTSGAAATKRHKQRHHQSSQQQQQQQQPLLPGLPDHLAQLCLSLVPPSLLYSVCHSWRRLIYSPSFPPFLSLYTLFYSSSAAAATATDATTNSFLRNQSHHPNQKQSNPIEFLSFDPISSKWNRLTPPPSDPDHGPLLLRHPSFLSRNLPIQSVTVSDHLVLLAATNPYLLPALPHPYIFHPDSNKWHLGPRFSAPRRWCAAGATSGKLYMVSGVGSHYSPEVARSAERCDLRKKDWLWERVAAFKDGRFSRDAVEAVGWRGKLCMVNLKGNAPKEGAVYDVENDRWKEMPEGMLVGWNGPATAMEEEVIFVVDEDKGVLRKYNPERDCWEDVVRSIRLKGAAQIAAAGGKICAVHSSGVSIIIVDMLFTPPRLWTLETPPLLHAFAIHILPRISCPELEPGF
ncbi:F-box/kelch-repeat protein SKIP25 [Macadamia integrifolia]|uniref:F-box/kelch-repeat protein SKIP25 n=1 Tax=Macadamia integrifolia TaxID=60698 RepID=UPI001C4EA188|nr:F-box/kelch-repeat protein SKIP25 [Macadamia integrifolia]